jgi:hypothetical protein
MNRQWILDRDFDSVVSTISQFKCVEVTLVIKPLQMRPDFAIFGCYIPTIPRPTSIISGKIYVRKLPDHRTEIQASNFQDWAAPFISSLIEKLTL